MKNDIPSLTGHLTGKCLISTPGMADPRFERTVVYVCSYSEKKGTIGLVVNKPASRIVFEDVLKQVNLPLGDKRTYPVVLSGGPVQSMRGFVLHSSEYVGSETTAVNQGFSITSTVDILSDMAQGKGPNQAILALGCSRWNAGQLEAEIAGNSWLVMTPSNSLIFDCSASQKWVKSLNILGVNPSMLSITQGFV